MRAILFTLLLAAVATIATTAFGTEVVDANHWCMSKPDDCVFHIDLGAASKYDFDMLSIRTHWSIPWTAAITFPFQEPWTSMRSRLISRSPAWTTASIMSRCA